VFPYLNECMTDRKTLLMDLMLVNVYNFIYLWLGFEFQMRFKIGLLV